MTPNEEPPAKSRFNRRTLVGRPWLVDHAAVAVGLVGGLGFEPQDAHVVVPLVAGELDAAQEGNRRPAVRGEADRPAVEGGSIRRGARVRPLAEVEEARPSRKKARFSGKRRAFRVRLTSCSSASVLREVGLDGQVGHQVGGSGWP